VTNRELEGKLRIRPMEHEDITDVLAIDRKITGERRAITYTDLITGDLGTVLGLSFVAELSGQIVGFILARHTYFGAIGEACLIHVLGIDPDYWRQGIATKLVNTMLERCSSKGLNTVRVMINEKDSQLHRFFSHVGFLRGQLTEYTKTL
jgi:GNAT superfamily N-acetyltransferase